MSTSNGSSKAVQGSSGVELINCLSPAQIVQANNDLRQYFNTGATKSLQWRKNQLKQLRKLIVENEKDIQDACHKDLQKPYFESWFTETEFTKSELDFTLKHIDSWAQPRKVSGNILNLPSSNYIYHDPLGEVLIISPWNYPVQLLLTPYVGALAAGNTVLLKPSEATPHTANLIAKLIPQYMDPQAVKVINGGVKETTEILKHRYDLIFYTGNGKVGSIVMTAAAKHLTPVILELGGKSPTYVGESANLQLSAKRIAWAKYSNAGQTCIAPDYLLVHEKVKQKFLQLVKQYIDEFYGTDPTKSADYGRIVNQNHVNRLKSLLDQIGNATVYAGGKVDVGNRYIEPTILDNVQYSDKIMEDEIFGPILPTITVSSKEEAVKYINSRDKPLAIYIYSSDNSEIQYILENTSSGGVGVNDSLVHIANHHLPFGGVGGSGIGSYHGQKSFASFSHEKSVLWRPSWSWTDVPARYPPATSSKKSLISKVIGLDTFFG